MVVSERPFGTFTRQLFLGESLDADAVEANYEAGVMTLTIPVAAQAKPRKLQVTTTGAPRSPVIEGTSEQATVTDGGHGDRTGPVTAGQA